MDGCPRRNKWLVVFSRRRDRRTDGQNDKERERQLRSITVDSTERPHISHKDYNALLRAIYAVDPQLADILRESRQKKVDLWGTRRGEEIGLNVLSTREKFDEIAS